MPRSEDKTEVGNYFVANYPPFSFWTAEDVPAARAVLRRPPGSPTGVRSQKDVTRTETPLGLYLHIPFCRKRCKFCYFRVYTDKNSKEVERYARALSQELELYSQLAAVARRQLGFVYFGGGTPSFLSVKQLGALAARLCDSMNWETAEEVTFECEPGTLTEKKLRAIRGIGVTRLSLGVENFSDSVLEENGRAHHAKEIHDSYRWARDVGFPQINIDLIAGMVGETWDNWKACIEKTIDLAPDSVTIYQMELPFNTVYSRDVLDGKWIVADWSTKREWVDYAFSELDNAGYAISSAYTVVREGGARFVYRDALWHGADLIGTGVASFSHVGGVHYQNFDQFDEYIEALEKGELPLARAYEMTPAEQLRRELILQMKLGRVSLRYFRDKFGADLREEFSDQLGRLAADGLLEVKRESIKVTRSGLLRVDSLLTSFFDPQHQNARYT